MGVGVGLANPSYGPGVAGVHRLSTPLPSRGRFFVTFVKKKKN